MPHKDGIDIGALCQIDLNPLFAGSEFDPRPFVAGLVAIGDKFSVPVTGLLSLDVTFLPLARLTVPAGIMKSGRLPFIGGSRFGTLSGTGVPTKRGRGSWVFQRDLVLRQCGTGNKDECDHK